MGARLIGQPPGALLAPRMCQPLYGSRTAQLARLARPPEKSMSEMCEGGFIQHQTPSFSQIAPESIPICTFLHSIVLNGPERARKSPRNGPSCTLGTRTCYMGQNMPRGTSLNFPHPCCLFEPFCVQSEAEAYAQPPHSPRNGLSRQAASKGTVSRKSEASDA